MYNKAVYTTFKEWMRSLGCDIFHINEQLAQAQVNKLTLSIFQGSVLWQTQK